MKRRVPTAESTDGREVYHVVLRPELSGGTADPVDPVIRLRKALKVLLRTFRLRCVRVFAGEEAEREPKTRDTRSVGTVTSRGRRSKLETQPRCSRRET